MKVSVVTVCYNAEKEIEKTIQSVFNQTESDFEYIIIDGNSSDKTLSIVNRYKNAFRERNIKFSVISEPDSGIYDAMNKGVLYAVGDYVIFINAGDLFLNQFVLERCKPLLSHDSDVVYGDCIYTLNGYYKLIKVDPLENIKYYMPLSHQSTFVKRDLLDKYMFSTEFRIAGDYNLLLTLYENGFKFTHVDEVVSIFALNGISETNIKLQQKEHIAVRKKHGYNDKYNGKLYNLKLRIRKFLRTKYQTLFPTRYFSERRGWVRDIDLIGKE